MAPKNEVDVARCTKCGEAVEYPDFKCKKQPGNHTLPVKNYYHLGGATVASIRDRRLFNPLIILVPGRDKIAPNGDKVLDPGLSVHFEQGQYATSDAEQQYYLNLREFPCGDEGLKRWRAVYLTPEQNRAVAQAEYEDLQRKIEAGNSLLEQQKKARAVNG